VVGRPRARARLTPPLGLCHNVLVPAEPIAQALRRVPVLASLPADLLARVAALSRVRSVARGEVIFAAGEEAAFLPLLLAGQVKLFRTGPDGREQVLHLVRAPSSFAEAAVFGPGVFPVTAQTVRAGTLASVPRTDLLDLLREQPAVALALLASMSLWLRRLADLVEGLSLHTVEERVAAYFVSTFGRAGTPMRRGARVELDDPKHLIAALCGTAPEVLSRTFRRLESDGLLRVEGTTATVLDPVGLVSLAATTPD